MSKAQEKRPDYPSTFTLDNFSSTTKLTPNDGKFSSGSRETIDEKNDAYNPFEHRVVDHPNSSLGSLVHLLKSSLGTGILAMPLAFKNGGLLFGFIGTIVTGILCTHCVHMLVAASHEVCKRSKIPSLGFSETAGAVFNYGPERLRPFAPTAKIVVDVSLVITYFMGGGVYTVFICESMKQLMDFYYPDLHWSILVYMAIVLVPLVLSCQIRELKYLVPFSFAANIFMIISFVITLYYMFIDLKGIEDRELFSSFAQLPLFFSTVIFAMEGIGVVMPVENNMAKPQQFLGCPGVLNIAMGTVVFIYAIIGFFGYLTYGDATKGSVTFNLPTEETLAQVAKALIALAVFFTFSLQFYVPMDITWRKMLSPKIPEKLHNISQITVRTLIVAAIVGVAAAVPNLEPIITLVGSICFSTLGIFIPAVVETILIWEDEPTIWKKVKFSKNLFLACFAMFALVSGTYYSILSF